MRYAQPQCELVSSRDKGLRNFEVFARHKELVDLALQRYLQKPDNQTSEHLEQAMRIYRDGYERQAFKPPTGSLYVANNQPPETHRFRG